MDRHRIVGLMGALAIAATVAGCGGSSASPTAAPNSMSDSPSPAGTSQPPASWTALDVTALSGAPIQIAAVIPWTRGYVAFGNADAAAPLSGWSSPDGRTWTPISGQTFGLDAVGSALVGGTECGGGLLVATADGAGAVTLWSSSDATEWAQSPSPTGNLVPSLAGNSGGAVVTTGGSIFHTTDCSAWKPATFPGTAAASVSAVASFGGGFVAVGSNQGSSPASSASPVAWWSADGQTWVAAAVPADPGLGLSSVAAGAGGLIAYGGGGGQLPGPSTFLTSPDGHSWSIVNTEPLGTQGTGADVRLNGGYVGDGAHLLGYGQSSAGATEYWISTDGNHWTKLVIGGASAVSVADGSMQPYLMRDGVILSGSATFLGTGTP